MEHPRSSWPLLFQTSALPLVPGVYVWDVLPVFDLYPACLCLSPYPWYPAVSLYRSIYLSILQQIHCICILLYPTVSNCIRTHLAVSSCVPLYLTVSHRLEYGIWPKIHSSGGLTSTTLWPARPRRPVPRGLRIAAWPLHDIANPNCVRYMAYTRGVGGGGVLHCITVVQ